MQGPESTFAAFVKSAFYKACFCLGLGTAAYHSYAQVQNWSTLKPTSQSAQVSQIQEKVNALQVMDQNHHNQLIHTPGSTAIAPQAIQTFQANPNQYVKTIKEETKPVGSVGSTESLASSSPAPSPVVSPSPGEATADNKDQNAEVDPTQVNPDAAAAMAAAPVISVEQAAAYGYPGYGVISREPSTAAPENNANPNVGTVGTGFNPNGAMNGTTGTGFAAINTGSPVSTGSTGGSTPIYTGSSGTNSHGSNGTSAAAFLSQADINLLISPMKASFSHQALDIAGLKCEVGQAEGTVRECSRTNHFPIHTSRFSTTEGLASDASLVIKASSGSNQLQVNFSLTVQDLQQNLHVLSASVSPREVLVHNESRNGKNYRVFELKLPNLSLRATDHLSQVSATLYYEISASGAVISSDSKVNFSRTSFLTMAGVWDFTQPNQAPAPREDVIHADQVIYSMNLEKSL